MTVMPMSSTAYAAAPAGAVTGVSNAVYGIRVKWKADSGKTGYYIYRKSASSAKWRRVKTIKSQSTLQWTDENVANGKRYIYKVCSYKGSRKFLNTFTRSIYRLSRPGIKALTSPGIGKLRIEGYGNSAATGYQIMYSRTSSFEKSYIITSADTAKSKTISNLKQGQKYYVRIRAYKKVGGKTYYSAYSKYKSCKTKMGLRRQVVNKALYYNSLKTEYVHDESTGRDEDGNGKIGFDCSGFAACVINQVMQKYVKSFRLSGNIEKLHDTTVIYNNGYENEFRAATVCKGKIDWAKLREGDVLFFNLPGGNKNDFPWNHCAIYIGNKKFIHSTRSADGVEIRKVEGIYYDYFESARRYIPSKVKLLNIPMTTTRDVKLYPDAKCYSGTSMYTVPRGTQVNVECTAKNSDYYVAYVTTADGKSGFVYKYNDGKLK